MEIASSSGESDAGARAIDGEDEPDNNNNDEKNNDDQECSTARHVRQFDTITGLLVFQILLRFMCFLWVEMDGLFFSQRFESNVSRPHHQ